MNILVVMPVEARHKKLLQEAAGGNAIVFSEQPTEAEIAGAEIIIGNPPLAKLPLAKKLRWLQLNSAGSDAYAAPGVLGAGVKLTNATGAYGLALSEHLLAQLLAMMKKLYPYYEHQQRGEWSDEGTVTSIEGATALIIGFGDIGRAFGKRLKALGAHVIGIRRRPGAVPPEADEMGTMEELETLLCRADIVASSLPEMPSTHHLYDARLFGAMKKGAYFLNIGRGTAVVQADLMEAVKSGHLAGAALDVTEPEPLPKDSPLWHTRGIYITPHISGNYHLPATHDKIIGIAAENLRAFQAGEPLRNEVDFATGYRK